MADQINLEPQLINKVAAEVTALEPKQREALQERLASLKTALSKENYFPSIWHFSHLHSEVKDLGMPNTLIALDQVKAAANKNPVSPNYKGAEAAVNDIEISINTSVKTVKAAAEGAKAHGNKLSNAGIGKVTEDGKSISEVGIKPALTATIAVTTQQPSGR